MKFSRILMINWLMKTVERSVVVTLASIVTLCMGKNLVQTKNKMTYINLKSCAKSFNSIFKNRFLVMSTKRYRITQSRVETKLQKTCVCNSMISFTVKLTTSWDPIKNKNATLMNMNILEYLHQVIYSEKTITV